MPKHKQIKFKRFTKVQKNKRKRECEFCHKKFKRVQQHQQFCKARSESSNLIDSKVRKYDHIPITRTATAHYTWEAMEQEFKNGYEKAKKEFHQSQEGNRLAAVRAVSEAMTSLAHFVDNMNGLLYSGRN